MKYTAAAASLLAATASAAAVPSAVYKVTDFSASCIPHSGQCSYAFNVLKTGSMDVAPGIHCSAMLTSDGLGTLPPVTDGTCEQSSRTWTVEKAEDGSLTFTVSSQVSLISYTRGNHVIPADEIVVEQTGASQQEVYTGPKEFDLLYTE